MTARPVVIPDQIGPYRVLRPLASGGSADVYEVEDPASGSHLALKLLVHRGAVRERFLREYEALTRINHPNIVRVYHLGMHEGMPWLTMELLDGMALQVRAKSAGRPGDPERTTEAIRICHQVAEALDYLHSRGLVHRDLKSANVVVLPDGRVKLLDFGSAHVVDALQRITRSGEFVGTYAYASPEQLKGSTLDARADLYSLGVLLYRLVTGRRPFDSRDTRELVRMHLEQAPTPPTELVEGLPSSLSTLILKLLSKPPEDRPPDAGLVADFLRGMLPAELRRARPRLAIRDDRVVGREREQRELVDWMQRPNRRRSMLVQGPPGSARERFARGVGDQLRELGWTVRHLRIEPEAGALRALGRLLVGLGKLPQRVTEDAEQVLRALDKATRRRRVDDRMRKAVVYGASRVFEELRGLPGPLLVGIDALECAGPDTAEVIATIHRTLSAQHRQGITLLCTTDLSPDAWWKESMPDARRTRLEPFDVEATARAVGAMTHRRPLPAHLAQRVLNATGGHPGYIEEMVRELVAKGALRAGAAGRLEWPDGVEQWPRFARAAVEEVEAALGQLPVAHRRLLEAIALAGPEGIARRRVVESSGLDEVGFSLLFDALCARSWVRRLEGQVRFQSEVARQLVVEGVAPCRRRQLERAMAASLREVDSPARVRLLLAAGQVDEALMHAVQTARRLRAQGEPSRALDLLDPLIARMSAARTADDRAKAEAYVAHASCLLAVQPNDGRAVSSLTMARALAPDELVRGRTERIAGELHACLGRYRRAERTLDSAWEHAERAGASSLRVSVALAQARGLMWAGKPGSAQRWIERAEQHAASAQDPLLQARASAGRALYSYRAGQLLDAEEQAGEAVDALSASEDLTAAWDATATWAEVLRQQARFSAAVQAVDACLPDARRSQMRSRYVRLLLVLARCEIDLYRLGRAQEIVEALDDNLREAENLHLQLDAQLVRARIRLVSGQPLEARQLLQATHERARAAGLQSFAERARSLLAEAVWAMGDREEAGDIAEAAWLGLLGTGDVVALGEACVSWARAVGVRVNPSLIFQPVEGLLVEQRLVLVQLERLLATARWRAARKDRAGAREAYNEAASTLNRIATQLGETERAALRVHPWARRIRRGLQ